MSQFYVGQKVVCVDDRNQYGAITAGKVYTIRCIHDCGHGSITIGVGATYRDQEWSGYSKCPCGCRIEGVWHNSDRFRPLDNLTEQIERIEQEGAPVEQELEPQYA